MGFDDPLEVEYTTTPDLIQIIKYCAESISKNFDRWEDPYARGPGLYFLIVSGTKAGTYADPLGENRWPTEKVDVVTEDIEAFIETAESIAFNNDGAVVISADGTIQPQMVRVNGLKQAAADESLSHVEYADWMGTRHLSAVEASVREEVLGAVTLSEETGRVTTFQDGKFEDTQREEIGGQWRARG